MNLDNVIKDAKHSLRRVLDIITYDIKENGIINEKTQILDEKINYNNYSPNNVGNKFSPTVIAAAITSFSQDDIAKLRESFELTFTRREAVDQKTLYNAFNQFAVIVLDIFNRELGIGWTSSNHTANFVPVYAIGAGADLFRGSLNNIEIPGLILRAADLD